MSIPPHRHTASEIIETEDDYLLPYLRSLLDPSKIERTIIEGPEPLLEGSAFPTGDLWDGELFKLTQKVGDNYPGTYRYDLETTTWVRFTPYHFGNLATEPTAGMIKDDTYYNTTEKKGYRYDGTNWIHDDIPHYILTDVGPNDHHSKFTSGDHAGVEHLASYLKKAIQPYNSNINFIPVSADPHDSVEWEAGSIKFADGGTQAINAGSFNDKDPGTYYIYFTVGSTSLSITTEYSDVISDTRGLLAMVGVVSDTDEQVFIQPFYSKGLNIIADVIAVKVLSAICAHLGNVDIADGDVLLGDSGIIVKGEKMEFQDINGVKRGTIYGVTTGAFAMYAPNFILLMPGASGTKINAGPLFPGADGVQSLGTVNTRWRYFVPISTVGSRPAASSSTHGLMWRTREGAGSKTYVWICVQNDENDYEWMQLGVST